jgi:hypothetical protein
MSLLKKDRTKQRTKQLKKLIKLLEEEAKNKTLVYVVDYPERII